MDSLAVLEDIEVAFENYDIQKMLVICPNNMVVDTIMTGLKKTDHSVSTFYSKMNPSVTRWNMNQFLTNHTRTLICSYDAVSKLNTPEYESIWKNINFIVCIYLPDEVSDYWIHREVQHEHMTHYVHIYEKEANPQYYIRDNRLI
jgi:superfamily II DNA/RNA helicase